MNTEKLKQLGVIVAIVFVGAVLTQLVSNQVNLFESDWSTWQIILNSALLTVFTTVLAWLVPFYKAFGIGSNTQN